MKFKAHVQVMYKPEITDPHGTSIRNGLRGMGFEGVEDVRSGKEIELEVESTDLENATQVVDQMCKSLLAHPVSEFYTFHVEPTEKPVPIMEPETQTEIVEEVSVSEPEVKMTMLEKLLYLFDHKETIDSDCLLCVSMLMEARKTGEFAEWLNEETNLEIIQRWQRFVPKLFGRTNKYIFTDKDGAAGAHILLKIAEK